MANAIVDRADERAAGAQTQPEHVGPWSSWIWPVIGAVLLLFENGANTIALATWLAPLFLLRFVRTSRWFVWLPIVYALRTGAFAFQFRGMVPIPGIGYYIFLAITGLVMVLPFAADRVVAPRLRGIASTLVFPLTATAVEYLTSLGPYGSWCSIAYSQYGNLPLLQVLSVTGLWGVTFLVEWFAAVGNLAWEEGRASVGSRRIAATYLCVLASVMLIGGARLAIFPPYGQTVRVASLTGTPIEPRASDAAWDHLFQNRASEAEASEIRRWAAAVDDDLLERAGREAAAGAKIIFWAEGNATVFKEDEAQLVAKGKKVAAERAIYLGMAMIVWHRGENPPMENKIVLIQPNGEVAWEYNKARPVPGGEAAMSITKDGKLRSLETPYGRISSIICFDADFPQLLRQAGLLRADIVLDPSNDWRAIDPWHTRMASFRAIEQGFNLIRHTSRGLSAAYDYQGHELAAMDHYRAVQHALVSEVSTHGVRTLYSLLGDWFAWGCLVALLGLVAKAIRLRARTA